MSSKSFEWKTFEHHHVEKSNDWFWAVGIVAVGIAFLAVYFGNLLFALVILLAAFVGILHAHTPPKIVQYAITRKGVQVDRRIYSYSDLESFWVIDEDVNDRIIIRSSKLFMPLLILPYDSTRIDPEELRDYLLDYLDEEELEEPLLQIFFEKLGF